MPKFLRRISNRYSRLGRKRKKKQVWRNPTGRHNKMREKRKGYPIIVSIGYRTEKDSRGKINGKMPVKIMNVRGLEKIGKNNIIIIGNIGRKKKMEIIKIAKERNIEIANRNFEKMLREEVKKEVKTKITAEEAKKIIESNKGERK